VGDVHVLVRADDVVTAGGEVILRRICIGADRLDDEDVSEVLLQLAAQAASAGAQGRAAVASLTGASARPVDLGKQKLRNRLETLDEFGGRPRSGSFPAEPSDRCPRCPHWFACGCLPAGDLVLDGAGGDPA
jgi:DNA helicase II / ATP-dependent DNA helicase PcrA